MDLEENKGIHLENLTKEELIKQCRKLIENSKRCKACVNSLDDDNNTLKQSRTHSSNNDAVNEILEKFTDEKLQLVNQIEDLKSQNHRIEQSLKIAKEEQTCAREKIDELETENVSYQRRVTRLTDENEQLLNDLSSLEIEIENVNKLGAEQREQLLEVEKCNESMQKELTCSLEEVEKLKSIVAKKELVIKELTKNLEASKIVNNTLVDNGKVNNEVEHLGTTNENYHKELTESKITNDKLKEKVKSYHTKLKLFSLSAKEIKQEKNEILQIFKNYTIQIKEWKNQLVSASKNLMRIINNLECENKILKENNIQLSDLKDKFDNQNQQYESKNKELNETCLNYKIQVNTLTEELESNNKYWEREITNSNDKLQHSMITDKQLAEKSIEEILKLTQTNKELEDKISQLVENLDKESKKPIDQTNFSSEDGAGKINFKRENTELLHEMKEMNQALKFRGETISKLEAHCNEIKKKLLVYETQANKNIDSITEKDDIIQKLNLQIESLTSHLTTNENSDKISILKDEIESLREKLGNDNNTEAGFAESETMSSSTISKAEESNRMKDLEGSWEERYGKLRNLAVKLKAKIKEQTLTISELEAKKVELQQEIANIQNNLQTYLEQINNYQDELTKEKLINKQYLDKLNVVAETVLQDKQKLAENEELILNLNRDIEQFNEEKLGVEAWKKQVGGKVQTLRKELEAKNLLIKESESEIFKLQKTIESKEKELKDELENHKQTKNELEQTLNECKRNSVLNLEMQDYEKSLKELSQKSEKRKIELDNCQTQLDTHKTIINELRHENKLYEERLQNEEDNNAANLLEITTCKKMITDLEEIVQQKELKIFDFSKQLESLQIEKEDLATELTKVITVDQKSIGLLKNERDQLRNQIINLQQNLRESMDSLKMKNDELDIVKEDYEAYKIRAQNLFKKSNNRDVSSEEKLRDEIERLKSQNGTLDIECKDAKTKLQNLQQINDNLVAEKSEYSRKYQDLANNEEKLKRDNEKLLEKYKKEMMEHAETIRNLKIHSETLSQCYRQQLAEQETRHNKEVVELQSLLDKAPSPTAADINSGLMLPNMPREEGEGSENIEESATALATLLSTPSPPQKQQLHHNHSHPVPLERLLDSESTGEVTNRHLKKQVTEQESKLIHLTALLSDTEQDLAKHIQMNKVLKEEIRRQQRSAEREQHAENLEYLKNVVIKFVTLNSGDERCRLVPVLNTILKLSPEETRKLIAVAKGDAGLKAWASYLPLWSSPSKPE